MSAYLRKMGAVARSKHVTLCLFGSLPSGDECKVIRAENAEEALSVLGQQTGFKLVVIAEPADPKGTELARRMRQAHPETLIWLISRGRAPKTTATAQSEGAHRVISQRNLAWELLAGNIL